MGNRVVKVTIAAEIGDFKKKFAEASQQTKQFGSEAEKLAQARESFNQVGRAGVAMGALLTAGIGVAVSRFADFDQAMSNVEAATHESAAGMVQLRDAALDAGASTVFSATEAAGAIEELSKAGVSTADILSGGLSAALDLAAAGGLGVSEAAGIAATSLKVFNLQGADMSHVADLLAAGAGKAMGDVSDLSQALAQGGQVAAATGLSIEETTATLAAFASQGLLGSDAGTSFKTMLQRLTPQSKEAAEKMQELGISAYDASGNFIGMEKFAGNLQHAMAGLSPEARSAAMSIIFGSDAVRAANVLYTEGAKGIADWTDKVNDQGYAAETARMRLDNLKGDLEALSGAMDTAFIQTGSAANESLRTLVQALTGLVDMYNQLPAPAQATVLAVGGAAAAIALTGGAALLAVPKIAEFKNALTVTGLSLKTVGLAAGGTALAIGGVFAIVGALAQAQADAQAKAQAYADALKDGAEATRKMVAENLTAEKSWLWVSRGSAADAAEKFGISLSTLADAAQGSNDALQSMSEVIAAGGGDQDAATRLAEKYGMTLSDVSAASTLVAEGALGEASSLEDAMRINEQKNKITQDGVEVTKSSADAYVDAATQADQLTSKLNSLIDTINKANGVGQDAVSSNLSYQDALAKVDETITKAAEGVQGYSATLDLSTQAGRDNMGMLVDLSKKAQDAADAQFALDGNTGNYKATLEASRQALIDRAQQLGMNADQAQALADQIFRIPSQTEWNMIADTAAAQKQIDTFIRDNNGRVIGLHVAANPSVGATPYAAGGSINPEVTE
ncbi:phage tail tape measure protein [Microbacterium hominis]|uniref:phage tail tape measure protein n=1 Tax=Microbacterium hominis TaxID=162426 RepID=UPI0019641D90|nr:phage tail tape measure protein [Microbacterium hominis]QRY40829.1 phage tail tape measure protein [Microbacterium hominis]